MNTSSEQRTKLIRAVNDICNTGAPSQESIETIVDALPNSKQIAEEILNVEISPMTNITLSAPVVDRHPKAETGAIKLDSLTDTLLEFDEYCNSGNQNLMEDDKCHRLLVTDQHSGWCRGWREDGPMILLAKKERRHLRCESCKADYPNGLTLVGRK